MVIIPVVETTVHALERGLGGDGLHEGRDLRDELEPVGRVATHLHEAVLVQQLLAQRQDLRRPQH